MTDVILVDSGNNHVIVSSPGPQGAAGPAGAGVASGGDSHSVLTKASDSDYDTEWKRIVAGSNVTVQSDGTAKTITISATVTGASGVSGPVSSGDGHVAVFDGTSGAAIKDSGVKLQVSSATAGDLLVRDSNGAWVNRSQAQVSGEGTWLAGKPLNLMGLSDADLIAYHQNSDTWKNVKKSDLVDGGNF